MNFVPGRSLRDVLRETGPLPEPLVRSIARQIAGGLAALHAAGMVHGDLKPENVRLDAEGNAVLLDLGFARSTVPAPSRFPAARPGSLPYLSPEQARGGQGTEKSDVFALGVLAFELATGLHPFSGFAARRTGAASSRAHAMLSGSGSSGLVSRTALEKEGADRLLAGIATAHFVPPSRVVPQISPFIDRLLEDVLQRDPARRPTAADLERRLTDQESGAWWRGEVEFGPSERRGGSGERDASHRTPLVGREREMATLLSVHEVASRPSVNEPGAARGAARSRRSSSTVAVASSRKSARLSRSCASSSATSACLRTRLQARARSPSSRSSFRPRPSKRSPARSIPARRARRPWQSRPPSDSSSRRSGSRSRSSSSSTTSTGPATTRSTSSPTSRVGSRARARCSSSASDSARRRIDPSASTN